MVVEIFRVKVQVLILQNFYSTIFAPKRIQARVFDCGLRLKCEMLRGMKTRPESQHPSVVMVVGVKYEISDSVTVALPNSRRGPRRARLGDQAQPIKTIPHHWPGPSLIGKKWRGFPY